MAEHRHDVIIVGGGPAGLTAGLYAARSKLDAVLLERGFPGGQLLNTELIEDYTGFESILGSELAERMAKHALKFGLKIEIVNVSKIEKLDSGEFKVTIDEDATYVAPALILTAGGTPVRLGIPGEQEFAGKGVSYCAICDGAFFKDEVIAVVGGGDAAVEEGDFLTRYGSKVYLIHRRDELRAQKVLQERAFRNPKMQVIWDAVVEEILGDEKGVTAVRLKDVKTGETRVLPVGAVFIFIGFNPNTANLLEPHVEHDAAGYLITDRDMRTSLPGLFAAGDVRAQLTRQITTAVGDATTAAIAAEKYLTRLREEKDGAKATEAAWMRDWAPLAARAD
jgi:thioredoxin reductase (NADPH)